MITELLTSAQMRAVEMAAIEAGSVTGLALMEKAGQGVVEAVFKRYPYLAEGGHVCHVLCGPGNNGGDGYVIARLLAARGWAVHVFTLAPAKTPDAKHNAERWAQGSAPLTVAGLTAAPAPDLTVDAVFGMGLTRGPGEDLATALRCAYDRSAVIVAVDAPSGFCLDSGRWLGGADGCVAADMTVTFESPKVGHYLAQGPEACGQLETVDLGLSAWRAARSASAAASENVRLLDPDRDAARLRAHFTKGQGHKYSHGHVLVLAGGMGRTGAARLAARAALRVGAGAVTLGAPGNAVMECANQVTAIMLRRCDSGDNLEALVSAGKISTLVIGPGLGLEDRHAGLVRAALATGLPCVLDADALTLIARHPELRAALHAGCILTPHMGEFARLWPDLAQRLTDGDEALTGTAFSKIDATRAAAASVGCTVLLKGPDTVIAEPNGRAHVHAAVYDRTAPWLATAGAGDVLAGFIAGGMAQSTRDAAWSAAAAAWLHVEAARAFGPGLIAEDLPEIVPNVLRKLFGVSSS